MSAIIKTLKLKDEQILPKTVAKAVFTEDGYSVEDKLKNIGDGFSGSYNDLTDKPVANDIEYNSENSEIQANNVQEAIDQIMDLKGANNGFAALDSTGKIPQSQIPSMDYIPISQKGVANGVATLDNSSKISIKNIPLIENTNRSTDWITMIGNNAVINTGSYPSHILTIYQFGYFVYIVFDLKVDLNSDGTISFEIKGLPFCERPYSVHQNPMIFQGSQSNSSDSGGGRIKDFQITMEMGNTNLRLTVKNSNGSSITSGTYTIYGGLFYITRDIT